MYELARWSLSAAFVASAGAACSGVLATRFSRRWWRLSLLLSVTSLVGVTTATGILSMGLVLRDFRLQYVDSYTSTSLQSVYSLSALWAGQSGSLLFWTFLLAVIHVVFLRASRGDRSRSRMLAHTILASLACFFMGVVAMVADPFVTYSFPPAEGMGLNPLLQNVQMLFHPPTLYLGYLVFAVPFALIAGALLTGEDIHSAFGVARPWLVGGWALLTLGIVLGMQWAYVELGWGGYWSWDPVENASLIPWLSATAMLHALCLVRRRRLRPVWGAGFVFVTFLLCLLGALLARGGLVTSVHAFSRSPLAAPLLWVSVVSACGSAALVLARRRTLACVQLRAFGTRDWLLVATVAVLAGFGVAVTVGTWWPAGVAAVQRVTGSSEIVPSLTRTFYDRLAVPTAVVLAAALWACSQRSPSRRRWVPMAALVPGALLACAFLRRGPLGPAWAAVVALIVSLSGASVLMLLVRAVRPSQRSADDHAGSAPNRRRQALMVTHLGLSVLIVALSLSEGFSQRGRVVLKPGDTERAVGMSVHLDATDFTERSGYEAMVARVTLSDQDGNSTALAPELRAYHGQRDVNAELAVRTGLVEDLLVAIAQASPNGRVALIVSRRPGVLWIWVGGALMVLGAGASAVVRRRAPRRQEDGHAT